MLLPRDIPVSALALAHPITVVIHFLASLVKTNAFRLIIFSHKIRLDDIMLDWLLSDVYLVKVSNLCC